MKSAVEDALAKSLRGAVKKYAKLETEILEAEHALSDLKQQHIDVTKQVNELRAELGASEKYDDDGERVKVGS